MTYDALLLNRAPPYIYRAMHVYVLIVDKQIRVANRSALLGATIRVCELRPDCSKAVPVEKLCFLPIELALLRNVKN